MIEYPEIPLPIVSVIIPCFNHGKYLPVAIASVLKQSYPAWEIIVVNDGSTDNTSEIAKQYEGLVYVYQENKGLASARNTGIRASTGKYFVFLDADDFLYENAIGDNISILEKNPAVAFVSGAHKKVDARGNLLDDSISLVGADHYQQLLQGNYIGMHAAVMYQRWVFDEFKFQESLDVCEDYDLYLRIARRFPVIHHNSFIAAYVFHGSNMSGNIAKMLARVLDVLESNRQFIQSPEELKSLERGKMIWKSYYSEQAYLFLTAATNTSSPLAKSNLKLLLTHNKPLLAKLMVKSSKAYLSSLLRKGRNIIPDSNTISPGKVSLGDLDRTTPFSTEFGYDRGGPVDRYYIENFLEENKQLIHGNILEIGDNTYSMRFGETRVKKSDIMHIDSSNANATIVGDLTNLPQVPDNAYDCIVLTQTLHLIFDYTAAIKTCYRILKPGGTLLLTVPGISQIANDQWQDYWMWSFTQASVKKVLTGTFAAENITTKTHGNVLAATAFLYGLGAPELTEAKLKVNDPNYQVIITAVASKT
jgi:glycosyltransferase involved in cell wall biosynthesis